MTLGWAAAAPGVDITDNSSGAPWWALIIVAALGVVGGWLTAWTTRKRDRASNEQTLIDQLQQEVASLRTDLTRLQSEVRTVRVREIAWIRHTAELTSRLLKLGGDAPPLPRELIDEREEVSV